jgi:release factor glutamine methyltransferase
MSIEPRTLGTAIAEARARFAAAGIGTAALDARLLAAHVFGCEMAAVIGHPERTVGPAQFACFEAVVRRRLDREPLAYILGEREFWSLSLRVTRDTLIPRPETETLIQAALAWHGEHRVPARILDLGTGSGCLLLALLVELPEARGVGVDRSEAALAIARDNADRLGFADRASFVCGNWATALSGEFHLVVCNPPYIADAEWAELAPDVRDFEPSLALRAGADGLAAYRVILSDLPRLVAPNGAAFLELGGPNAHEVAGLAAAMGLQASGMTKDLAGHPRCLRVCSAVPSRCKFFLGNQSVPV